MLLKSVTIANSGTLPLKDEERILVLLGKLFNFLSNNPFDTYACFLYEFNPRQRLNLFLYYRQRNILLGGISREEHHFCNEKGAIKVFRVP